MDLDDEIRRIEEADNFKTTDEPVEKRFQDVRDLINSKIKLLAKDPSQEKLHQYLNEIRTSIIEKLAKHGNIEEAYILGVYPKVIPGAMRAAYKIPYKTK